MVTLAEHPDVVAVIGLGGATRDAAARRQELLRRRADAVWLGIVGEVDRSGSYVDDGHRTPACWVAAVTNCSKAHAKREVRSARMVHDLPEVGDALLAGHLGASQIVQLTGLWSNPRVRPSLPALAAELVERACLLPPDDFQQVCDMIRLFADPDGGHRDHETSRANRRVSLVPDGAGFRVHVEGDAISGAILADVLAKYAQVEFDLDWAAGVAEHGDRMCPALLRRTNTQRQFDGLMAMVRAAQEANAGHALVPLVNIHCDAQTAEDVLREHFDSAGQWREPSGTDPSSDPDDDPTNLLRRRCNTDSGAPVDRNDLLIALLIGRLRKVVHGSDGRVISLGHRSRLFRGGGREAALLADHHCSVTGCHISHGRLEIDHTIAWATRRGPSDQTNADPLCNHHNKVKERLGLALQRDPHMPGGWITYRCDGSRIGVRTSPATSPPGDSSS
ncbi:MAG: hypothetical protein JWM34_2615 [Ilumatobacteraceae bacterium]|nr:hypothetical protein [Ilumatobacteraceae bacterium]